MPSSARDYPNVFRGSGYYQPGQVVSNGYNLFRAAQAPGRTKSGAAKVSFKPLPSQKVETAPAPEPAPAPKPKPKAKPKAKPPAAVKDTSFQDTAKKMMDGITKKLESLKIEQSKPPTIDFSSFNKKIADLEAKLNKPAPAPKLYNTGSIGVQAAPLQINAAAPTPQTSGVDSFKRRKPAYTPAKTLTSNALNI